MLGRALFRKVYIKNSHKKLTFSTFGACHCYPNMSAPNTGEGEQNKKPVTQLEGIGQSASLRNHHFAMVR